MAMTLQTLNTLDQDAFVAAIGHVFERSPWIAADAWLRLPFASVDQLHQALMAVVWNAAPEEQLALIEAHPDLAGKAAIAGELTADSRREQASAGLDRLTPEQYATFTRLNAAYRERFGFPFIVCVREHTSASILAAFELRLAHERRPEIAIALTEIGKIARLRLQDAIAEQETADL
jgi:OHCU decarboxylase